MTRPKGYAFNRTRTTYLATDLLIARTHWSRFRGLMATNSSRFSHGQGLWINPSHGIHSKNVRFTPKPPETIAGRRLPKNGSCGDGAPPRFCRLGAGSGIALFRTPEGAPSKLCLGGPVSSQTKKAAIADELSGPGVCCHHALGIAPFPGNRPATLPHFQLLQETTKLRGPSVPDYGKSDGYTIGTLKISKGSLDWRDASDQFSRVLKWEKFAKLAV